MLMPSDSRLVLQIGEPVTAPLAEVSLSTRCLGWHLWPTACCVQEIGALEMHGTGTALGDPIEIGASTAVLQGAAQLHLDALQGQIERSAYSAVGQGSCLY